VDVADALVAPPRAFAVLLHPHPDYGGNRYHPFIGGLFSRLPSAGIATIRFDFSSGDSALAREEALGALKEGTARWPSVPAVIVGYSFGAGIASALDDPGVAGWYLLAPQVEALNGAVIGDDPRPKAIAVPEFDQFSPPVRVAAAVSAWQACTVTTVAGADHFLGAVEPIVTAAAAWVESVAGLPPS